MSRFERCAVAALALAMALATIAVVGVAGRNAFLERAARDCAARFRQRIGEDAGAAYSHVTLDGGLTWWRFKLAELPDGSEAVLIEGPADPEVVRRLDALEGGAK